MQILSAKYSEQPIGMSNHYHDCHQILYIVSGKVIAKIGEKEYCAEDGSVLILSRFEEHSIRLISSEYKRYTLRISADIFHGSFFRKVKKYLIFLISEYLFWRKQGSGVCGYI